MNDIIPMAILQSTPNLPSKLSRNSLSQPAMFDDIIEHVTTADVLKNHVVVVLVHENLVHAANMWMM
jgi:hypothetical protein